MIQSSHFNGIDFSTDRLREGSEWLYNYQNQRVNNKILVGSTVCLVFKFTETPADTPSASYFGTNGSISLEMTLVSGYTDVYSIEFVFAENIGNGVFRIDDGGSQVAFSEYCEMIGEITPEMAFVSGINDTNEYGVMGGTPFAMLLDYSKWKSKTYYADKDEFEYTFGRKITISSETNLFDRFTFLNLSQYQQNCLRALSDMQTFKINGIEYSRVSDWTVSTDDNTELADMTADFAKAEFSEFEDAATVFAMTDITPVERTTIFDFLNKIKRINYGADLTPNA